ncbi:MAG: hypothetical protein HS102_19040 [Planctomycetia bacterium]|nr:hypothetical protein [Planctomycetia bacterium]
MIDEYTNDGDDKLTLKRSGGSACEDYPDGLDCNVLLHGTGTIKVQLDNRAFVLGDYAIVLDDRAKTGTSEGWWIAENNGSLTITCDVSGAGHWFLADLGRTDPRWRSGRTGASPPPAPSSSRRTVPTQRRGFLHDRRHALEVGLRRRRMHLQDAAEVLRRQRPDSDLRSGRRGDVRELSVARGTRSPRRRAADQA